MEGEMSFFKKYATFEKRIEAAIAANDARLVQALLGPKYCQLWQLWLVHGIISSKVLNMEIIVNSRLCMSILDNQMSIINDHKAMLEKRRTQLCTDETLDNQEEIKIEKRRHLIKNLMIAVRDSTAECRDRLLEELNNVPDYRAFYIPEKLLNDSEIINSEELSCLLQQVSTISRAEKLFLNKEVDHLIEELGKRIESNIWEVAGPNTKTSYYLGEIVTLLESSFTSETLGVLTKVMTPAALSDLVAGSNGCSIGVITVGVLNVLRNLPPLLLKIQENSFDNPNSLSCVMKKLEEVDKYICILKSKELDVKNLNEKLKNTCSMINDNIFEKLNDGKFINKNLVKDMYLTFLYNYLDFAKMDESNLLSFDIKKNKGDTKAVAKEILNLTESVNYETFIDVLHKELKKETPNYDVISVFIVNSTPLMSYKCSNDTANRNMERLMKKSFHTIMIDVNNLLFNFVSHCGDTDTCLISHLPNRDGTYTQSCQNNLVICGSGKQGDLIQRVRSFADEIEELIQKGSLNRARGIFPSLYFSFFDFFKGLFSDKTSSSSEEEKIIQDKIREFYIKISHSVAVENEGIIKEYIEDINERLKHEKNRDVCELYKIVLGKKWADIFREKYKWESTPYEQSLEHFMKVTNKRINAFKILEERNKAKETEERAKKVVMEFKEQNEKVQLISELHCSFGKTIFNSSMNQKIKRLMFEQQDTIVKGVADYIIKHQHRPLPHRVLQDVLLKITRCCNNELYLSHTMVACNVFCSNDCFLNAFSLCINHFKPDEDATVTSLKDGCKLFARASLFNRNSWLSKELMKEKDDIFSYIKRITSDSRVKSELDVAPIFSKPEIEGRILCEVFGIKLHLVEYNSVDNKWSHQIIDKSSSTIINDTSVNYQEDNVIHMINEGDSHYTPIVNISKIQIGLQMPEEVTHLAETIQKMVNDFHSNT